MLFSSYVFVFCFLPLTLAGFFVLGRLAGRLIAASWLASASLVFYGWWNPAFLPLLMGSIAFNYALARLIAWVREPRARIALLASAITADVAALVYFKYLASLLGFVHAHGLGGYALADSRSSIRSCRSASASSPSPRSAS